MNPSTTSLDLNIGLPNIAVVSYAVQGDQQARVITAHLYDGSDEWTPPAGAIGIIRFRTSLGTSGIYDTDEDGNTAVTWSGNVATLRIVQNAIAVAGCVPMQLEFYQGSQKLSSFSWMMIVEPSVLTDTEFMQTDYYNILTQQISAIITALEEIPTASTSNPLMDGTASPGTANTFSRGDHRHPSDTTRVPTTRKVNNKALSADITLTAEDIGYDDGLSVHATGSTGKAIADLKGSLNTVCLRAAVKTISGNGTSSNTLTGLTADHVVGNWGMFSDANCTTPIPENSPPCDITITTAANAWSVTIANYSSTFYLRPTFILKQN